MFLGLGDREEIERFKCPLCPMQARIPSQIFECHDPKTILRKTKLRKSFYCFKVTWRMEKELNSLISSMSFLGHIVYTECLNTNVTYKMVDIF